MERRRRDHLGDDDERTRHLVEGVEEWLLVLLEITVVREGQALQRDEEAREIAHESPRLSAGKFGDIGVLLLRKHRRSGGVAVVERRKAELLARPQHPLLTETREMHAEQGQCKQGLGDVVAVGHRVERIGEPSRETERGGGAVRVDRQRRSGERTGAER